MSRRQSEPCPCALCERPFPAASLSRHHAKPRSQGGKPEDIVLICAQCHSTVHANFTNETLAAMYPTAAKLQEAPELQPYLQWVRKQPPTRRLRTRPRREKL